MLNRSRTAAEIAASLYAEMGQRAVAVVSARVEAARQASDAADVGLWHDVAETLVTLAPPDGGENGRAAAGSLWGFMQRIEYCRHRAEEFERKAAAAPEAYRQDMLELAGQWRDLALHTDLQARSGGI
jgi:hypothetical protein